MVRKIKEKENPRTKEINEFKKEINKISDAQTKKVIKLLMGFSK